MQCLFLCKWFVLIAVYQDIKDHTRLGLEGILSLAAINALS